MPLRTGADVGGAARSIDASPLGSGSGGASVSTPNVDGSASGSATGAARICK